MPEEERPEQPVGWEAAGQMRELAKGEVDITPENLKSEVPVLLVPGWGENSTVFEDSIEELSGSGRRVMTFSHPRRVEHGDYTAATELMGEEYPQQGLDRALNILEHLAKSGVGKVDVVAHSQGGIDIAIAASIEPDRFRNVVFVDPGGMIGEDTFPKLMGRFSRKVIHDSWLQIKEGHKYVAKNPWRAAREAVAISRSEINDMLKDLHDQGTGIVVIHGVDDPVFPMDRVQEMTKAEQLDGFLSVKGGHDELHRDPARYTRAAEEMLTALERKKTP